MWWLPHHQPFAAWNLPSSRTIALALSPDIHTEGGRQWQSVHWIFVTCNFFLILLDKQKIGNKSPNRFFPYFSGLFYRSPGCMQSTLESSELFAYKTSFYIKSSCCIWNEMKYIPFYLPIIPQYNWGKKKRKRKPNQNLIWIYTHCYWTLKPNSRGWTVFWISTKWLPNCNC